MAFVTIPRRKMMCCESEFSEKKLAEVLEILY